MARYVNGNNAIQYDRELDFAVEQEEYLSVVEGNGSQDRTDERLTLSPVAKTLVKCIAFFATIVTIAAFARILIISQAFGLASQNSSLNVKLDEARSRGAELQIQQSVYGRSDRIYSIATGVYGMVPVEGAAYLDLSEDAVATEGVDIVTE